MEKMDTSLRIMRRHKLWPEALKREIVAASLAPGASVLAVARQYDVNTNLVFTWRRRFGEAAQPPTLNIISNAWHPEWNYTIRPRSKA